MRLVLCALFVLAVVGCAGVSMDAKVAASCQGYASTLSSLAELRAAGELNERQVEAVDSAVMIAGPICRDGEASQGEDLMALSRALRSMSRIQTEVE